MTHPRSASSHIWELLFSAGLSSWLQIVMVVIEGGLVYHRAAPHSTLQRYILLLGSSRISPVQDSRLKLKADQTQNSPAPSCRFCPKETFIVKVTLLDMISENFRTPPLDLAFSFEGIRHGTNWNIFQVKHRPSQKSGRSASFEKSFHHHPWRCRFPPNLSFLSTFFSFGQTSSSQTKGSTWIQHWGTAWRTCARPPCWCFLMHSVHQSLRLVSLVSFASFTLASFGLLADFFLDSFSRQMSIACALHVSWSWPHLLMLLKAVSLYLSLARSLSLHWSTHRCHPLQWSRWVKGMFRTSVPPSRPYSYHMLLYHQQWDVRKMSSFNGSFRIIS